MNEGENSGVPQSPVFSSEDLVNFNQMQGGPEENVMAGAIISSDKSVLPPDTVPEKNVNPPMAKIRQRFVPSQNKMARAALALSGNNNQEATKDNRKMFAIIGAVALALVILVFICIFSSNGNTQKTAQSEVVKAWNIFGNYLLTGSEKEAKIAYDYRQSANIAIKRASGDNGEEAEKRNSKIEDLYKKAVEKSGNEQQELKESARIVMVLQKIPSIPDNTWITYYMVNGDTRDSMRDKIYERYALINDQGTPKVVRELLSAIINASEDRINLAEKYIQNGCVEANNVVDSNCKKMVDSWHPAFIAEINRKMMNIETIKRGLYSDLFKEIAELGNE